MIDELKKISRDGRSETEEKNKFDIKTIYRKYGIIIILLVMVIVSSFLSDVFLRQANVVNIMRQISIVMLIACGVTMVIIAGMIDLSSGSVVALAGTLATGVMVATGSVTIAILTGVFVGALCGLVNGLVITKFNIPPFIMTLAMMTAARGLALLYTGGMSISGIGNLRVIGQGIVGIIPVPVIIMSVIVVVTWVLLNRTRYGRYLYAIGGNEEATIASGVNVKKVKIQAFLINGMFVGLAGVVLMGRINSGQPAAGVGYEFDAITAAVLGGTSLYGGTGSVQGTLIGALIIGILNNIMNLTNVSPYFQQIVKGIIIAVAVILDIKTKGGKS